MQCTQRLGQDPWMTGYTAPLVIQVHVLWLFPLWLDSSCGMLAAALLVGAMPDGTESLELVAQKTEVALGIGRAHNTRQHLLCRLSALQD